MSESELSRRSFLVVAGGTVLGTFALPGGTEEAAAASPPTSAGPVPTAEDFVRVRRLMIPPQWSSDRNVMVWVEETDEDEDRSGIMVWRPETPEEWEEAERFCAAANYRTWNTFEELKSQPPKRGKFVIRWIFQPRTRSYLSCSDEEILFSDNPEYDDVQIFADDPGEAATFSHAKAVELIPRLMAEFQYEETSNVYFDCIPFLDAVRDYRQIAEATS